MASAAAHVPLPTWSAALESGQVSGVGMPLTSAHRHTGARWHARARGMSCPEGLPTARVSYSLASSSDSPAALMSFFTLARVFRSLLAPRAARVQPLVFEKGGEGQG